MIEGLHTFEGGHVPHLERLVRRDGAARTRVMPARYAIIEHRDGPIVFDTGYHPSLRRRLRGLGRAYHTVVPWTCAPHEAVGLRLERLGYRPRDVQRVVLSHLHADHVAGLIDLPDVPIALTRAAWDDLQESSRLDSVRRGYFAELLPDDLLDRACWLTPPPWGETLADSAEDLLGDGSLGVVDLPGHAPGQIGLWVRRDWGEDVLLVADATFSLEAVQTGAAPSRLFQALVFDDLDATRRTLDRLRDWSSEARLVSAHDWEMDELSERRAVRDR